MATTTADLLVRIDATTEQLRRELTRGEQAVTKFQSKTESSLSGIDRAFAGASRGISLLARALGPLGIAVSATALVSLTRDVMAFADEIDDAAQALGIGTEALQQYREAAKDVGVEAGTVDNALRELTVTIGQAASGEKGAIEKFKDLGIAFEDAAGNGRRVEDVLFDLADVIQDIHSPAERAAAAAKLLGERAGPQLVGLLDQGAAGLRNYMHAVDEAGRVMSEKTVERLAKAQANIEAFHRRVQILYGETIGFIGDILEASESGVRVQLEEANKELAEAERALTSIRAEGEEGWFGKMLGREATALDRYNKALERRNELLGKLTPRGKDDVYTPPAGAGGGGGGGGGGAGEQAAAVREVSSAYDEMIARMTEAQTLAELDGRARAELAAVYEAQAAAQRDYNAGLRDTAILTEAELDQVKRLANERADAEEIQRNAQAASAKATDVARESAEAVSIWADAYSELEDASSRALMSLIDSTADAREALRRLLTDLAQATLRIALFGAGGSEGGGIVNSLVSAAGNLFAASAGAPGEPGGPGTPWLARGGRVSAGRPYVVGEHRPELFVPDSAGTVLASVPKLGHVSSATNVTNVFSPQVTVQGGGNHADAVRQGETISRAMTTAMEQFFDQRLQYQLQPRGLLRPSTVS